MSESMSIGIAGAGLLGRRLAWRLTQQGHRVLVFDPALGPDPVLRSQAGEPYVPTAAACTTAGMLSRFVELGNAGLEVAAKGLSEQEALRAGMTEKSAEFHAVGSEFYVPLHAAVTAKEQNK